MGKTESEAVTQLRQRPTVTLACDNMSMINVRDRSRVFPPSTVTPRWLTPSVNPSGNSHQGHGVLDTDTGMPQCEVEV